MNNSFDIMLLLARVNAAHPQKTMWFLETFGMWDFVKNRIAFARAITPNSIMFKFFLKAFNHSFFLGDLTIYNIIDMNEFIGMENNVFLELPFVTYTLLIAGDGVGKFIPVSSFNKTVDEVLRMIT